MKLTGELKDKVDQAKDLEEAKEVIAQAGMLLSDDEVSEVAGGSGIGIACPFCGYFIEAEGEALRQFLLREHYSRCCRYKNNLIYEDDPKPQISPVPHIEPSKPENNWPTR